MGDPRGFIKWPREMPTRRPVTVRLADTNGRAIQRTLSLPVKATPSQPRRAAKSG